MRLKKWLTAPGQAALPAPLLKVELSSLPPQESAVHSAGGCTGTCGHTWAHTGTCGHMQAHTGSHGHTHRHTQAHMGILGAHTGTHRLTWAQHGHTQAHMGTFGAHMGTHKHTWTYTGTHGHTRSPTRANTPSYSNLPPDLPDLDPPHLGILGGRQGSPNTCLTE